MSESQFTLSPQSLTRRSFLKFGAIAALAGPRLLAAADAPDRTLSFYNLHTSEKLKVVYWSRGTYVPESLTEIDRVLRDHRTGNVHEIDCRLLDLLSRV